jgi:hypothetical protein
MKSALEQRIWMSFVYHLLNELITNEVYDQNYKMISAPFSIFSTLQSSLMNQLSSS